MMPAWYGSGNGRNRGVGAHPGYVMLLRDGQEQWVRLPFGVLPFPGVE